MPISLSSLQGLAIPQANINADYSGALGSLGQAFQEAQNRRTLADLGKGLADGTVDYKQAAGKLASTGNLNGVVSLLQLGEAERKRKAGEVAGQQFLSSLGMQPSSPAPSTSPVAAGPTVPNDSNALPGQVGMDLRLADRSQDFIQDNPGTTMSSGVRSTADQARLYADRGNNPNPVAPPGTSNHERGLAIDIGGMTPEQRAMLPQYGLSQPVANDPPHVELARNTQVASNGSVAGMLSPGNIDLNNRPVVHNPDGSISTVRSISANFDGKEVLIPTVSEDGRIMSNQEAIDQFKRTGRNLGVFDSEQSANAYAQSLHDQQANRYLPVNAQATQGFAVPGQVQPASGGLSPRAMQLIGAMSNPNLPQAQREIGGKLLAVELEQSKLPDSVKQYVYAKAQGYQGTLMDFKKEVAAAGKTEVNINQTGEKEYEKQNAKDMAEMNRKLIEGAQSARMKLGTLTRMDQLLSDPKIYTGAGGEQVLTAKKLAKAAGFDVGDVSGPEAIRAIGNQFALELRNPAGGAGMPGAMSDKDREFLQASVPGLTQTPEGNRKIVDYMKRVAQRSLDVERLRQDYVKKNGRLNEGFYRELDAYSSAHPLFPEAEQRTQSAPPMQGARQAPDGNWYVQQNGKYFRVDQ